MSLAGDLGIGKRELVSFVGAGGKTTLLLRLGQDLVDAGRDVVLTTTTKMGTDQIPATAQVVRSPEDVGRGFSFLVGEIDEPKVIGVNPGVVDDLYQSGVVDFVLVEADGARRRSIKAPADHEPVVPTLTTIQVSVVGLDAIGGLIGEVAHRPEVVGDILGKETHDRLYESDLATVVLSPRGGLARLPAGARLVVALTQQGPVDAARLVAAISDHPRVERVVVVDLAA